SGVLNQNPVGIFVSSLREWLVNWEGDRIVLTNKPSYLSTGVSSFLDRSGVITRITSGTGLTVLPNPAGTRVLYATSNGSSIQTNILTINGQTTFSLPIK